MGIDPRPPDLHLVFLPIEVAPLQTQNLADPQPQARCHNAHRAVGFRDLQKNFLKLLDSQYSGQTHALRGILHPHEAHGIGLSSPCIRSAGKSAPMRRATLEMDIHFSLHFGEASIFAPGGVADINPYQRG